MLPTPDAVFMDLSDDEKREMIECLREELDPPINVSLRKELGGEVYLQTAMSNGWVAVYRLKHPRFRHKRIVLFDLLHSRTVLYSARDLRTTP
jgi:hypothetical protein